MQSRYYNPEWNRFVNADDIGNSEVGTLLSHNLFAYCLNNPVNMEDPDGDIAWWIAAAASGAAIDAVFYLWYTRNGGFSWRGLGKTALKGAITGVAFGAAGKIFKSTKVMAQTIKSSKILESSSVQRAIKKLSPEAKKGYTKAINALKNGDTRGLNEHALTGSRKGQWAVDIKGMGKGRGKGRVIFTKSGNGSINIIEILTDHRY